MFRKGLGRRRGARSPGRPRTLKDETDLDALSDYLVGMVKETM
jgi:hypothetical protein